MTIGAIGSGSSGGDPSQASRTAPSSGPAANADSSSDSSVSPGSADQVTYRNPCGDTVTLSGIVVVNRSGNEVVGQPATSDCSPTSQKLAKAYSAY